jgi:glycosyltransferase involved in cell wall biosynthesis
MHPFSSDKSLSLTAGASVVRPTISVVTPSYNQSAFIQSALESVKLQGHLCTEHIVMDGTSTDGTVEYLNSLAGQTEWGHLRWISEPDKGQSDALNKGFHIARGDLVAWLNSDDRYRTGCFDAVIEASKQHPEVDVFYGDYTWIDEHDKSLQIRREIEFSRFVLGYHRVLYIPTTSTFLRRRIFEDGNYLDTRYHYAMDYEFFLRLANRGYRFRHIPQLLADFRWHSASKSSTQRSKHLAEHDEIARQYSSILRNIPGGIPLQVVRRVARLLAAGRRYSEKLLRGYYFDQFSAAKFSK